MGSSVFHPGSVPRGADGRRAVDTGLAQALFSGGRQIRARRSGPLCRGGAHRRSIGDGLELRRVLRSLALRLVRDPVERRSRWYEASWVAALAVGEARGAGPAASNVSGNGGHRRHRHVLLVLVFSKYVYLASFTSYYTFYLIHRFHVSVENAQMHLFVFLAAVALGTIAGGPLGDRVGRRSVIWVSILGAFPFAFVLPMANLFWTGPLTVAVGFILASAFPAIVVFAQDLVPGKVGMISGLFFGFSFGIGGLGAAALGWLADRTSIETVYRVCAFLPLIGMLAMRLPKLERR